MVKMNSVHVGIKLVICGLVHVVLQGTLTLLICMNTIKHRLHSTYLSRCLGVYNSNNSVFRYNAVRHFNICYSLFIAICQSICFHIFDEIN